MAALSVRFARFAGGSAISTLRSFERLKLDLGCCERSQRSRVDAALEVEDWLCSAGDSVEVGRASGALDVLLEITATSSLATLSLVKYASFNREYLLRGLAVVEVRSEGSCLAPTVKEILAMTTVVRSFPTRKGCISQTIGGDSKDRISGLEMHVVSHVELVIFAVRLLISVNNSSHFM